jgi:hypothetical protein
MIQNPNFPLNKKKMLNKLYSIYILQAVYKRIIFQVHTLDLKCDIGQCSKGNVHGERGEG